MTRKEFVKMCGILGIGMAGQGVLSGYKEGGTQVNKVIIIGAGAGGMSAGYLLNQLGIEFELLEASSVYGGRMRIDPDFTDFPIALGSEWIETDLGIFDEIVNDNSVQIDFATIADNPDRKFVNYSWFNFFEDHVVPSISGKIEFNTIVESINYEADVISVTTQNGIRTADRVIVAVPLRILQDGDISFVPDLPQSKRNAISSMRVWDGFKAFFEFTDHFYDDMEFTITPETDGQKLYYDAAFGQNSTKNILGLFTVGTPAQDYISRSGDDLRDFILAELDGFYDGQATQKYVKHIIQNWNAEPFIKCGYMSDYVDYSDVAILGESIDNKILFAGGAYTDGNDWVSIHTAARSAKVAIDAITG
ncbi:MAG: monoamine oxidase [Bacteroidia bacterium]|jgi:monoamine oxidase